MKKTFLLAKVFLLELLREKLLLGGLIVGLVLCIFSGILGSLSFSEKSRIIFHLSFSAIHLVCLGIVVFFGASALHKEVEKQTCLLVLARPVTRTHFYLGKFFAIAGLFVLMLVILGSLVVVLLSDPVSITNFLFILAGVVLEISTVLAVSLFASVFLSVPVALFASFGIFLLGHWLPELHYFSQKSENLLFIQISNCALVDSSLV